MKITILVVSERRNGNCHLLAQYAEKYINSKGNESEVIFLKDYLLKQCQGCMSCVFKNTKCKLEDDLYPLAEKVLNTDAFILIAPTYVLTIPGKLKVFLDRFLCLYPLIKDRPEIPGLSIAVASPIDWNQFQLPLMNMFLLAIGCRVIESYFIYGAGQGEVLLQGNIEMLEKSIENIIKYVPAPFVSVISKYCPVDFCNLFQKIDKELYKCPVCLTPARSVDQGFYFDAKDLNNHRWTKHRIEEHFRDWILTTKERFRRLLPEIYKRKKELEID